MSIATNEDLGSPLTFFERGLRRARIFLGTENLEEVLRETLRKPNLVLATDLAGTGAETDLAATPLADGGGVRLSSGATANSRANRFMASFDVSNMITTSGWMLRARFRHNQATGAREMSRMSFQDGTNREAALGVIGATQPGGNATKYVLIKRDAALAQQAGATSTVTIDTLAHDFEIWHPPGSNLIYAAVDAETPISMATGDMGDGKCQILFGSINNADAVDYASDWYQFQLIVKSP